jgi:hypothetical protein
MSSHTSDQIIAKSTLVKAFLQNIVIDIRRNKETTLTSLDIEDLNRAMKSCDQLIDIGNFVSEQACELKELSSS